MIRAAIQEIRNRANFAYKFFVDKGWSSHAAQALVGNLMQESRMNPVARGDLNKRTGQYTAFGMGQWRGDRAANLKSYAAQQGRDWTDFQTQLGYLDHELRTTEGPGGRRLMAAKNLSQAVNVTYDIWRPKEVRSKEVAWRLAQAQTIGGDVPSGYTPAQQTPRLAPALRAARPSDPGMMTPGAQIAPAPMPEDMPASAYPSIPPPPPAPEPDPSMGQSSLAQLGQAAFPDNPPSQSQLPDMPPVPDPAPFDESIPFQNEWHPVPVRFRERFANLFGGAPPSDAAA
jgi:hypothetical protein